MNGFSWNVRQLQKTGHLKEHMAGFSLFGGSGDYHQSENGSTNFRLSVFKVHQGRKALRTF